MMKKINRNNDYQYRKIKSGNVVILHNYIHTSSAKSTVEIVIFSVGWTSTRVSGTGTWLKAGIRLIVENSDNSPDRPPSGSGDDFSPHKNISSWNSLPPKTTALGNKPTEIHFEAELLTKNRFSCRILFFTRISYEACGCCCCWHGCSFRPP